ncbi:MAG: galactokinase [Pseudomonadota bacterium]
MNPNDPMAEAVARALEAGPVAASAPCRVDMGGTLDLPAFHYPLRRLSPATVNIALSLRTRASLSPWEPGRVRVRSLGFQDAEFDAGSAPYDHPLGMMFALCDCFAASGVCLTVESASPPRSALGGSSVAAVAVIAAFARALSLSGLPVPDLKGMVLLAHAVESAVAGVVCGLQDQLAAAYGGVNAWEWTGQPEGGGFVREPLLSGRDAEELSRCLLVAYGGAPHESVDINGQWSRQFLAGRTRGQWERVIKLSREFATALKNRQWEDAKTAMNQEMDLRREMTPQVLDESCASLVDAARAQGCGARSTGAGGGGCVWVLGQPGEIETLRRAWEPLLAREPDARILAARVEEEGVRAEEA